MARPTKNNLDYFPHYNSLRNDRKIKALRARFGLEGYAIYNMLLEALCEEDLLMIKWDSTNIELVSGDLNIVSDKLTEVSGYLLQINVFDNRNGYIFCPQLDQISEFIFKKRNRDLDVLRQEKGVFVSEITISAQKPEFSEDSDAESTQRKEKERKEKIINSINNKEENPSLSQNKNIKTDNSGLSEPKTQIPEDKEKSSAKKEKEPRAKNTPKIDLSEIPDDFKPLVEGFVAYRKKDLKKPFKTQQGVNGFYTKVQKLSNGNVKVATIIADYAKNREWLTVYMNNELQNEINQVNGQGVRKLPGVPAGYKPPKRKAYNK